MGKRIPAKTTGILVYTDRITADYDITDRSLRRWIREGRFPKPDGNLNGKHYWRRSTYRDWQRNVLAGKYGRPRRPINLICASRSRNAD